MKDSITKEMLIFLEENKLIPIILAMIIAGLIFYMSSQSFYGVKGVTTWKTYAYHFGIFAILAFFVIASFSSYNKGHLVVIAIMFAILYGAIDEVHQFFVPGRACDYIDLLTDSIGILSTGIVYTFFRK